MITSENDIHVRTQDRWPSILTALGMDRKFLKSTHGPCPMCAGSDRWRFDDHNGSGRWWCNSCGRGNGVDLIMTWKSVDFIGAKTLIESVIGGSKISVRRLVDEYDISDKKNAMKKLWNASEALDGRDLASRYLVGRGIELKFYSPLALRWANGVSYWLDGKNMGYFTCMLGRWVAPDNKSSNICRVYLKEPGLKADLPDGARKMMPGPIPAGGAVRLGPAQEIMGVAEGIETALASAMQFDMPVWAVLGTSGMLRFQPPDVCNKLIIFGDRDEKFAGQAAAYSLAHRLEQAAHKRPIRCEVRVPDSGDPSDQFIPNKRDWNDVLMERQIRHVALRVVK